MQISTSPACPTHPPSCVLRSTRVSVWTTFLAGALLSFAVLAPRAQAQREYESPVRFTTIANGSDNFGPVGLATDAAGTVYVAEATSGTIVRFLPGGKLVPLPAFSLASSGGPVSPKFDRLSGVAVGADGSAYVANRDRICKIAVDGTVTILADGLLSAQGIAVDVNDNVYVAETSGNVIYKISPSGIVTTFAGKLNEQGSSDGSASARFNFPTGVAVDSSGTVFVADRGNSTIRKITPEGVVSTLAGLAGTPGSVDGVGIAARFMGLAGIAVDRSGTLYVTSSSRYQIRRITQDGSVSTLVVSGGFGHLVEAGFLDQITVDRYGKIYITDGWYWALLESAISPSFTTHLAGQSVAPGGAATFSAIATGSGPITYQWRKDGAVIAGATTTLLTVANVQAADLGNYTLVATNEMGSSTSNPAALTFVSAANRLTNLAVRSNAGTGPRTLIVGFVVGGAGTTGSTPLLVRAVGPSLAAFGVPAFLADPTLTMFAGAIVAAFNDNWNEDPQISAIAAQVGAFALSSSTSFDAALYRERTGSGVNTLQISGVGDTTGVALAEIYDATSPSDSLGSTPRLINLSARAQVGIGADILIAGFSIGGTAAKTLLVRAIGPTLSAFGVTGVLADPKLELFQGNSRLQSNDNWGGDALMSSVAAEVGAFALDSASRDSALLVSLQPGSYTVHLSGVSDTTGVALVEIYEVP